MKVADLLRRIDYTGSLQPDLKTLTDLQTHFIHSVPFENLDIHLGNRLVLELEPIWEKIVHRRRGGWCYELNETFLYLLTELGYRAHRVAAKVLSSDHGDPYDHQTTIVSLSDTWLVDVGFGTTFSSPVLLDNDAPQPCRSGVFRTLEQQEQLCIEREAEGGWQPQLLFSKDECRRGDFAERCHWLQTSPQSNFTKKQLCSMLTPAGRWTLSGNHLMFDGDVRETVAEEHYLDRLGDVFGISLGTANWISIR
ncbi:MAG: arylamine N-acetyltransferase [Pseudomonadales bacterium]|jgi:N-hydroxyarylamine O-acetyltransferase|nr:arylamine N-acetyltransferase [Pseudomonadales bacterium]MDP7597464.1 arylamine N-acetyltransferase [Pseudomonadales bacterium]HJN49224.1 arylamine N-acetyltransferase [Pseudomonadales bacterium]|tara:strand:+ start:321 stop:1076 length:756 start_codon:yes stop_codon:yes gene_type:complete